MKLYAFRVEKVAVVKFLKLPKAYNDKLKSNDFLMYSFLLKKIFLKRKNT